jgi:manganese/zinc/iron transport system substrate-binding protein
MDGRQGFRGRGAAARTAALLLGLSAPGIGACAGGGAAEPDGRLQVVATTGMIADAATRIGGPHVRVEGLMGPGVDPHLYRASAGDVRRLARADVVLYNGLHLEAAMGEVLEEMGRRRTTVAIADSLDPDRLLASPDFVGSRDPHVWFDVGLWADAVSQVTRALVVADPEHAAEYEERGAELDRELRELDAWVRRRVAVVPPERRVLVTAHDAFGYFGRAYGFEVRGLQGISTAAEAGTADVQGLAAEITRRRIPSIFVETSIPRRTIEAVQAAVRSRGFEVGIGAPLYSDALGSAGTPEATYEGMVRYNVEAIVNGLKDGR